MKFGDCRLSVLTLLLIFTTCDAVYAKGFGLGGEKHQEDNSDDGNQAFSLLKKAERADQIGDVGKALTLLRQAAAIDIPNGETRILIFQKLGASESTAGNRTLFLAWRTHRNYYYSNYCYQDD